MDRYSIALKKPLCKRFGHKWVSEGGRPCPDGRENCSQTVYKCSGCGAQDYGERGGPAWKECEACRKKALVERRLGRNKIDQDLGIFIKENPGMHDAYSLSEKEHDIINASFPTKKKKPGMRNRK